MVASGSTGEAIREAAGQVLAGGFLGADATPPAEVVAALRAGRLGGVVLFRRNIASLEQVAALNEALAQARSPRGVEPWIAVDQEGGRVRRLTAAQGASDVPAMRQVGDCDDAGLAEEVGAVLGRELAALGFNLDFAPVLDVDTNPANPVIGDRSFSSQAERVARLGVALSRGLLSAGVVPCGKHFPGHGDTVVDSHFGLPVVEHDRARLDAVELVPFRAAVAAGMPLLMTAHVMLPALDATQPATLSAPIVRGLLRGELGFEGLVVSDDLDMAAVAERYPVEELVLRGLEAGVELFLICQSVEGWPRAWEALVRAAEADSEVRERLLAAAARGVAVKARYLAGGRSRVWREVVGCAAHRDVLERLARGAQRPQGIG